MSAAPVQPTVFLDGRVALHAGDCLDVVRALPDCSVDAVVTDPPYALVSVQKRFGKAGAKPPASDGATGVYARAAAGFMGKAWDTGERAFAAEFWAEIWRVLKPGGHVAAFAGTRTYHRLACAIEDAGFEIRDQLAWAYGTGFPKSHDVSKAIDRAKGLEREVVGQRRYGRDDFERSPMVRQAPRGTIDITAPASPEAARWQGWGTALKPAWEPICLARKPLDRGPGLPGSRQNKPATVAANVLAHGTGALNIDACRVGGEALPAVVAGQARMGTFIRSAMVTPARKGRHPANILHDGSDEVVALFPNEAGGSGKASGHHCATPM